VNGCVTPSPNRCSICAGPLEGKYANALTCSSRCRQKAYRLRAKGEVPRRCNGNAETSWAALRREAGLTDCELRRALIALQVEVGEAARPRIGLFRVTEEDRQLFADDPGRRVAA
jgi:hypothetical protein